MLHNKKSDKRTKSTIGYVDTLSQQHSKLNCIRIDLGYKKPYSQTTTLEEANKDFNHMLNNARSKPFVFRDKLGLICKKEHTEDKGMHFHTMFIFDGQKVQKSAFKADQIGKYWEEITEGKGSYHNCHRNKYISDGIGILDHKDSDKRKILYDIVISYLCKDEQEVEPTKENKKNRAFTRGIIKKNKGNKGRPRE